MRVNIYSEGIAVTWPSALEGHCEDGSAGGVPSIAPGHTILIWVDRSSYPFQSPVQQRAEQFARSGHSFEPLIVSCYC